VSADEFVEAGVWSSEQEDDVSRQEPNPFAVDVDVDALNELILAGQQNGDQAAATASTAVLQFQTLADLCAEVDAAGPRRWLVRGIWPAGAYGVHGAEMKAQKTWNALDLAVSVASGTAWLGAIPVDDHGPVLIFAGEGGKASIVRRLRAVCASRGLFAEKLPIIVCVRAPHLSDETHLAAFAAQLERVRSKLVILDPLYLSARGGKLGDLYAMGEMLERAQHLCDEASTSLIAVTHYNRREGSGPLRFTGAGPAEWGRVLIGAHVVSRHTNPETLATTVVSELNIIGGEIPDQTIRIKRDISADDPDDIDSALRYHVEVLPPETGPGANNDLPPAARKLLEALDTFDRPATGAELVDQIADKHGHGLRRETVSRHLNELAKTGVVECANPDEENVFTPKLWQRVTSVTGVTSRVTAHQAKDSVTSVTTPIGGHAVTSHEDGHTEDAHTRAALFDEQFPPKGAGAR
jgi:hypothetical protein